MPRCFVIDRAEVIHMSWVRRLQHEGVSSRLSHWGEELMVPWDKLSDRAKRWNIDGVQDHDAAIELFDQHERHDGSSESD